MRVLIIEDEPETRHVLERALIGTDFQPRVSTSLSDASAWIEASWAEIVILNIRLGGQDCAPFFRWLVARRSVVVVLMSPTADGFARGHYLELGADEFVPSPVSPPELRARLRSAIRAPRLEAANDGSELFCAGPLILDRHARRVRVRDEWVVLTAREFALIDFLACHPYEAFDRSALLEHVWGYTIGDTSTVTVHVRRLREKLEADPARPVLIVTIWGVGYRFEETPDRQPVSSGPLTASSASGEPARESAEAALTRPTWLSA